MKIASVFEMKEIDASASERFSIPSETLMALAGRAVCECLCAHWPNAKRTAICAGTGNNGGDGFVAAWLLHCRGLEVTIYLCGSPEKLGSSSGLYFNICKSIGIDIRSDDSPDFSSYDFLVDAISGIGLAGKLRGSAEKLASAVNASGVPAAAIDIPSGLPADGEAPQGVVVSAELTVAMGFLKTAHTVFPGKEYCGRVVLADIGLPPELLAGRSVRGNLIDTAFMKALKKRLSYGADINKTDKGHLLIIGGFDTMEGAVLLTASAAFEAGAGLVTAAASPKSREIIAGKIPELMTASVSADSVKALLGAKKYACLVIGPGLGRTEEAWAVFKNTVAALPETGIKRVLIDGDGLFHLARFLKENALPSGISFVLTPHFMEASRIIGKSVDEIKANRPLAADECARKTGAAALLKGPASIVSNGVDRYINTTGCSLLAAAGSGDVLSGIAGTFLMRKEFSPEEALSAACFVHGSAADALARQGRLHIRAGDLIGQLKEEELLP